MSRCIGQIKEQAYKLSSLFSCSRETMYNSTFPSYSSSAVLPKSFLAKDLNEVGMTRSRVKK